MGPGGSLASNQGGEQGLGPQSQQSWFESWFNLFPLKGKRIYVCFGRVVACRIFVSQLGIEPWALHIESAEP